MWWPQARQIAVACRHLGLVNVLEVSNTLFIPYIHADEYYSLRRLIRQIGRIPGVSKSSSRRMVDS